VTDKRKRAARYGRISLDKAGDEHGVANQLADQERLAAACDYRIVMTEVDNDISAFTGRHRPGYEKIMAAARRGEIDVILVMHPSRWWRNRNERAAGIGILKEARVSIVSTRGPNLDMSTAYGRGLADLLGAFDTMESDVKGERQQVANEANAKAGKPRLGSPAPFGWLADRATADPAEAAAVLAGCRIVLTTGSVTAVMRDWERRGVRPHQAPGNPWTRTSVRQILLNPRNAGISVYKGEEVASGQWEALVPEQMWRAVTEALDPRYRRTNPGAPSTLLGGIGFCRCGNHLTGGRSAGGRPSYRCRQDKRGERPGPHVGVIREDVDLCISLAIIGYLSQPEAIRLLATPDDAEVAALRDEELILRARLSRLGALYAEGTISEADLTGGRRAGAARLAEVTARLAELGRGDTLAPLITGSDIAAAWDEASLGLKRLAIDTLMTVTLYPSGQGARRFDPGRVLPPGKGIVRKHG
jgi:DNA invertase Pin-like site-specific DNA recombinase